MATTGTAASRRTLSYGASMRVQERDDELIGLANINPLVATRPLGEQINAPGRFSVNGDDGNLNYDDGDLFSNAFKMTSEFSLNYKENWGAFARASYFYDWENADRGNSAKFAKQKVGTACPCSTPSCSGTTTWVERKAAFAWVARW
ncbi:MAG: DUF1302 family protein [Ahniella sp.]|nr:DUF1302 family protein [Ahniella sp.]